MINCVTSKKERTNSVFKMCDSVWTAQIIRHKDAFAQKQKKPYCENTNFSLRLWNGCDCRQVIMNWRTHLQFTPSSWSEFHIPSCCEPSKSVDEDVEGRNAWKTKRTEVETIRGEVSGGQNVEFYSNCTTVLVELSRSCYDDDCCRCGPRLLGTSSQCPWRL